ncbi:MAG: HoxN/HupN/NixA family nickel/cobalt transporter [Rudaea sp.]
MPMKLSLRQRVLAAVVVVLLLNLLAGVGTLWLGGFGTAGLGAGMVAYFLGVRHAFDADHIAAIDNVTRRLRAAGQRPAGVGLFFSLGHSTVVLVLTAAAAVAARRVGVLIPDLTGWGSLIGSIVSAGFLTLIGVANLRLLSVMMRERRGGTALRDGFGLNRLTRNTSSSWKMFPIGMLFGLSFDTASEVALLALSVVAAHDASVPLWGVLLLPALFTAGMASIDTLQSLLMLRLYDWAISDQDRTLRLNTVITGISVCLALLVALYEWIDLYARHAQKTIAMPAIDSSLVGMLATALLFALGVLAWWWAHRRWSATTVHR